MKIFFRYIKIYLLIASQYIKTRMQYRVDFFVNIIGTILYNIVTVAVLWILFHSISTINGWSYHELLFIYSFYMLTLIPETLFFNTFWYLPQQVKTGEFIKYYFKPLNMMFYFTSTQFNINGIIQLFLAIPLLVYSSINLHLVWNAFRIFAFIITLFSASLIVISLIIIGLSSSFWIINASSLGQVVMNLRDYGRYPISIFNKAFQFIFTFIIPLAFISFYPSQLLIKPSGQISIIAYFSPVAGIAFFMIAYYMWKKGVRRYSGTGT